MTASFLGRTVKIVDTTLRDGEQTAGVVFANHEKLEIARMLDELGIDQLEAGIPAMGGDEREAIKSIVKAGLSASIMAWNRANIEDIKESLDCGVDAVAISISTSDIHIKNKLKKSREWVLEQMAKCTEFAKSQGVYVSVNAEDASRTDMEFLVKFAREAKKAGADRLRFCDTLGILNPFKTARMVGELVEKAGIPVEMHTHNDLGMATANALAGLEAGATYVGVTVNGLGERAGNAPLEEVAMALKYAMGYEVGIKTSLLKELCEYVARASGRPLSVNKTIVGDNIFAHESGIHADGVIKDPSTYEFLNPAELGLERKIIIGKHSGTASIKAKLQEYGIFIDEETAKDILKEVRGTAVALKRPLLDRELISIYRHIERLREKAG
ncbi:homocitrate synthase [Thermoanaerobacterium sp. DL9XJH110]|uniref:homocitrate synthase n=1 Tax=Thermoanaerobacterium sp. DL9XJH110 TaxID=3386643 RepID=UPI003BB54B29